VMHIVCCMSIVYLQSFAFVMSLWQLERDNSDLKEGTGYIYYRLVAGSLFLLSLSSPALEDSSHATFRCVHYGSFVAESMALLFPCPEEEEEDIDSPPAAAICGPLCYDASSTLKRPFTQIQHSKMPCGSSTVQVSASSKNPMGRISA
jgi:hypothetical protein